MHFIVLPLTLISSLVRPCLDAQTVPQVVEDASVVNTFIGEF